MFKRTVLGLALSLLSISSPFAADWGCTTAGVNYRTGGAVSYQKLGTIPAYTRVSIETCTSQYGAPWCKVSWDSYSGWVAKSYLSYDTSWCESRYNQPTYNRPSGGGSSY